MSNRDIGIRALIPGQRSPDEIQEDENNKRYVETIVNRRAQVHPGVEHLGETLVRTTPTLNLEVKPKVEPKGTQKDLDRLLIDQAKGERLVKKFRQDPKWVDEHNKRFPRFKTTVLPKEDPMKTPRQLETLKRWGLSKPVGLGNNYKSDTRTPVQKKRDAYVEKQKWINDDKKIKAFVKAEDPTKGAHYIPWEQRMAQEEAEHLNSIKRETWNNGGRVGHEPKYVSAQDVINVYKPKSPEATPLQVKKLHQRLGNHNERTGELNTHEDDHPYIKGIEEDLQRIDDKGKSWFSKTREENTMVKDKEKNKGYTREFRSDDPTTFLSHKDQQKAMLLDTIDDAKAKPKKKVMEPIEIPPIISVPRYHISPTRPGRDMSHLSFGGPEKPVGLHKRFTQERLHEGKILKQIDRELANDERKDSEEKTKEEIHD